ncbi:MAG: hypothetical protein GY854_02460 [Deltaproteobacteria bacterium]|nr:hypothetical protein [Deltaproteobacteria bacterium]
MNAGIIIKSTLLTFCLTLFTIFCGCEDGDVHEETDAQNSKMESGDIIFEENETDNLPNATFVTLHEEHLDNGNVIEFLELDLEPGFIILSEVGIVPNPPSLIGISHKEMTVREKFELIRPNSPVPEVLLQAEKRENKFRDSNDLNEIEMVTAREVIQGPTVEMEPEPYGSRGRCSATWFDNNVCFPIIDRYGDYDWTWLNAISYGSKYLNNIYVLMKAALCADIGVTKMVVKVRKAWSWSTKVNKNVNPGTYRWYEYWCDTNNHDFYVRGIPESGSRYHLCGGTIDL